MGDFGLLEPDPEPEPDQDPELEPALEEPELDVPERLALLDLDPDVDDPASPSEGGAGGGEVGKTIAPRVGTCEAHRRDSPACPDRRQLSTPLSNFHEAMYCLLT